jgi:hypothetical protein
MFGAMGMRNGPAASRIDGLQQGGEGDAVEVGDVVRLERTADGTWLYCDVEAVLDDGDVICRVVEAQSWPNLVTDGIVPGRPYTVPHHCVLSVVRYSRARR